MKLSSSESDSEDEYDNCKFLERSLVAEASDIGLAAIAVGTAGHGGLREVMGSAHPMHNLKSLSMASCGGVTDLCLEVIANGAPNLKQLCLRACFNLLDVGLEAFVNPPRALETLELEECNRITLKGALASLLSCNVKLHTLALIKCSEIKDIVGAVLSCQNSLCMSLQSLTIRDCSGFTSGALDFIVKICPRLEEIDLRGLVVGVTDAALLSLISTLRKPNLGGCAQLTDRAMVALVMVHGKSLYLLHFSNCHNITDTSLLEISEWCDALVDLDASRSAITDYGISKIARLENRVHGLIFYHSESS